MSSLPPINNSKIGTCPHGLPPGACPICNGMGGGGGGGSAKKADKPEMSWSECYVVWQQMQKAKQGSMHDKNAAMQAQMISQYKLQLSLGSLAKNTNNIAEKLVNFIQNTSSSSSLSSKMLGFSAKLALPIVNTFKNVVGFADKALNTVKEKLTDISDKLNAVFGELKNSIEKKISDKLKDFKKKIKSLFGVLDPQDADDEEKKIEESKRLFEMKNLLQNVQEKYKNQSDLDELKD